MIDCLPGYASDLTAYEEAVAAAQADGWQIKGFSITWNGSDTLLITMFWKEDAIPTNAPSEAWGASYGPRRAILRAKHAEKLATNKCGPPREEDLANEPTPKPKAKKR